MRFGRRPVVTGIGLVCPLGADRERGWSVVRDGGRATFSADGARAPLEANDQARTIQLALRAAHEAWADSGLQAVDPDRVSCVVSSSKPIFLSAGPLALAGPERVACEVAKRFGAQGVVMNVASACATGAHSLLTAADWVREGRADVVLAGAAESALHPLYLAGFQQMGVLSKQGIVRPFDRARDGFVVGEGAAVFVVEPLDQARDRGADLYGEILGGNFSSDAHHATRFNSQGRTMAACLRKALDQAGLSTDDVDYVNAHGTATALNDSLETQALVSLFPVNPPPVSSTKGATGHLLGATGAVEIAFCFLALRDKTIPPTLNLENPETDRLDFVPHQGRPAEVDRVASLSFGFGGALSSVVVGVPA